MSQLLLQIAIGTVLVGISIAIQTAAIGLAMASRRSLARRVARQHMGRFVILISILTLWLILGQGAGVWLWAIVLMGLGAFDAIEPAFYFAMASYTTLGFGDVLPPVEWRVLGTLIGANGMIGFGLAAAALIELVQQVRSDISG